MSARAAEAAGTVALLEEGLRLLSRGVARPSTRPRRLPQPHTGVDTREGPRLRGIRSVESGGASYGSALVALV